MLKHNLPVVRWLLSTAIASSVLFCLAAAGEPSGRQAPNLVVIFTDDQGYNDVGCFGSPLIATPRLDRMAAEGMKFTNFYAQPLCGPSRAAIMTGCYPIRVGMSLNPPPNRSNGLHPDEITMAELLKERGYATACIGKWHLGHKPVFLPTRQGFDYFFGTPMYNGTTKFVHQTKFVCELMRNETVIERPADQNTLTSRYTEEAIEFIKQNKGRPFFVYLAHNFPHVPLHASKEFRGKSKRGLYGDTIEEIDWSTGRVLDTLKELGLERNTLVVFTSDNGPWIAPGVGDHGGSADPLRGAKMTTWEGGLRVPCIVRWPGKVPAGKICNQVATTMDLLPTFAKLAGTTPPADRIIDGKDIWPLMCGREDANSPHEAFYYYAATHLQAVRSGKWKLVLPRPAKPSWIPSWYAMHTDAVPEPQLFNLDNDIEEKHDVARQHPEVVARLAALVEKARADLGDHDRRGQGVRPLGDAARLGGAGLPELASPKYKLSPADGLGLQKDVCRRDPSDVIKVGDTYYVWYTKVLKGPGVWHYPSGYSGTVWYATSPDGRKWTERGEAIGKGPKGAWDEHGVFTPNILVAEGKYYLTYDGVPRPFSKDTPHGEGIAISDSPDGPWEKFEGNPVLVPSKDPKRFDSFRVCDSCLIVRDGKYWWYFKGRQMDHSPRETKMGVAIADKPTGPYVKHKTNPVTDSGHEVMAWPHRQGVATLLSPVGPKGNTIQYATDGIHFSVVGKYRGHLVAPGAYRPDAFTNTKYGQGIRWGIAMMLGKDPYLVRFDCNLAASAPVNKAPVNKVGQAVPDIPLDFPTGFKSTPILGPEKGVCRRDPSDVIKVGDEYFVWYTRILGSQVGFPSGYPGDVWYATSPDGKNWAEQGPAVKTGADNAWDGHGVFTPNILVAKGKYYLFYTAVPEPFDIPWTKGVTPTAIGVAVADSPHGPWNKIETNPILAPSKAKEAFDSFRVDDACLIVRDGKYWLYYKGRSLTKKGTPMHLAIAQQPIGPYRRCPSNPLIMAGHEVLVWPHREGVVALVSSYGSQQGSTIQYAPDGIHFRVIGRCPCPGAPGMFRADNFANNCPCGRLAWGVGHAGTRGYKGLHLNRFDAIHGKPGPATGPGLKVLKLPKTKMDPVGNLRFDFETGDLQGWKVVEGKFDKLVSDLKMFRNRDVRHLEYNKQGKYHLSTVETNGPRPNDKMTGVIRSPIFEFTGPAISFLIGGGSHPETYVALCTADGKEVLVARGKNSEIMRRVVWRPKDLVGSRLYIRIADRHTGPWGHVTFDDFSAAGRISRQQ